MKNRLFALLLSGALCLSLCVPALAASSENGGHWDFSDPSVGPQWVPDNPGNPSQPSNPDTPGGTNGGYDYYDPVPAPSSSVSTGTGKTSVTPDATVRNGTAAAAVSTAMGNEIVKQAAAGNSREVVVAPKITGSVTKTEVSIPASTVGQIGSQTNADLTVSTPVANVTIPNGGLSGLSSAGGTVTVTAEQAGGTMELSISAGGRPVNSIPGGLTLTVPVRNAAPGTVAVLIGADGTRQVVRKSVAGNGSVTIPLSGSARLEIVDGGKSFTDVPSTSWMAGAVAFASARQLFNGTAPDRFSPDLPMSRGMLAVVLHNLESNPRQALTEAFSDVGSGEWYAEGVIWAAANGIVDGYGNGQFGPNDSITREQLAVMLWRYAGRPAAAGRDLAFADAGKVSGWAKDALFWAVENHVINGKGNGILDPGGYATRAEAAQMLKNFMEK